MAMADGGGSHATMATRQHHHRHDENNEKKKPYHRHHQQQQKLRRRKSRHQLLPHQPRWSISASSIVVMSSPPSPSLITTTITTIIFISLLLLFFIAPSQSAFLPQPTKIMTPAITQNVVIIERRRRRREFLSQIFSSKQDDDNQHQKQQNQQNEKSEDPWHTFEHITIPTLLPSTSLSPPTRHALVLKFRTVGFESPDELKQFAHDFRHRAEVLSSILQSDFGFGVLESHRARMVMMNLLEEEEEEVGVTAKKETKVESIGQGDKRSIISSTATSSFPSSALTMTEDSPPDEKIKNKKSAKAVPFKSIIVNNAAAQRRRRSRRDHQQKTTSSSADYGLPPNYATLYPRLASELSSFYTFMTEPSPTNQDPPIRKATADVYLRHATQFLGWHLSRPNDNTTTDGSSSGSDDDSSFLEEEEEEPSISIILPSSSLSSSSHDTLLSFLSFLRHERRISHSYEANVLRGLLKLLKFRFRHDSGSRGRGRANDDDDDKSSSSGGSASSSGPTFEDIPLVRELRRWHREANSATRKDGRSSDESLKWITWTEYLGVVSDAKEELDRIRSEEDEKRRNNCRREKQGKRRGGVNGRRQQQQRESLSSSYPDDIDETAERYDDDYDTTARRRIAIQYQRYLILAFFSCVPDRQRTVRELSLRKNLIRVSSSSSLSSRNDDDDDDDNDSSSFHYVVKHGPEDYKTGRAYGDRPPLVLSSSLSRSIDDFVTHFRSSLLLPKNNNDHDDDSDDDGILFVQPRTGKPMTQDSIYQIVSRCCYKSTGKRTNPHLLRDAIVTHVRGGTGGEVVEATEKELESLALYMGHSLAMQRESYDRRTLGQKVQPAVELLRQVNNG